MISYDVNQLVKQATNTLAALEALLREQSVQLRKNA
jgi:hypothetical protein